MIGKTVQDLCDDHRSKIEDQMIRHGLTDVPLTDINKDKAVNDLMVAEVLVTRTLALDTLFKGQYVYKILNKMATQNVFLLTKLTSQLLLHCLMFKLN